MMLSTNAIGACLEEAAANQIECRKMAAAARIARDHGYASVADKAADSIETLRTIILELARPGLNVDSGAEA